MRAIHLWIFVAACGGSGGGNDQAIDASSDIDAKVFLDAPPVVPMTIMIGGKTTETGLGGESVVASVAMAAFASSNDSTPLAMATSDAQGNYTLSVMTNGAPLDGFLQATKSGYVDLYMYPTGPFTESTMDAGVNMMSPSNKDYLNTLAGGGQMAGKGLIGLQVRDASGNPVAGATISSTPASTYRYTNSSGLPSSNATSTSADGVAFMFNVPSGPINISAAKAGMTFKAHVVVARPDKFTTTSIVQ
jgi:hypothetical protein